MTIIPPKKISDRINWTIMGALIDLGIDATKDRVEWDVTILSERYEPTDQIENLVSIWLFSYEKDQVVTETRMLVPIRYADDDHIKQLVQEMWIQIVVERLEIDL